jgi:hypothetical protein
MKLLKYFIITVCLICLPAIGIVNASESFFTLGQLMETIPDLKTYHPQVSLDKKLIGKQFTIAGQPDELQYFHFSDPTKKLPSKITFADYVSQHDLDSMRSAEFRAAEGLIFDGFDASRANVEDDAYFNIVIRRMEINKQEN